MQRKQKIVLVDQDGVLADFENEFLRRWKKEYPRSFFIKFEERKMFYIQEEYPKRLRKDLESIFFKKGFFINLPVIPGAIKALNDMQKRGFVVKICTSPLRGNKDCLTEKHAWVEKYLGHEWLKHLIITYDKTLVFGDYLIDDKPIITGVMKPTWKHIIFTAPYNQTINDGRKRINGWDHWEEVIK